MVNFFVSGWETENLFQVSFFFHLQWIELSMIRFQGIHKLNNHFVQGLFVFKKFVIPIPVWIKNGIANYIQQCNFVIS